MANTDKHRRNFPIKRKKTQSESLDDIEEDEYMDNSSIPMEHIRLFAMYNVVCVWYFSFPPLFTLRTILFHNEYVSLRFLSCFRHFITIFLPVNIKGAMIMVGVLGSAMYFCAAVFNQFLQPIFFAVMTAILIREFQVD